jgi:hypothetical protein
MLLTFLQACGGAGNQGFVRLVNATSEYSSLDLYESSNSLASGLASRAAGDYVGQAPGSHTYNLKAGGASAISATTTDTATLGDHHTLVAYTSGGKLSTQILTDEESSPSSGTAKLRLFNTASADAGSVDIYVVNTACSSLGSSSTAALASSVSGLQGSYTEITATAAGTSYHVCVTAAGDKSDLRLDMANLTLTDQQIATLILTRSSGGVLLHGLLLNQQGSMKTALNTSARMRLAVGASNSATVTASANGTALGTNMAAPAVTSYKLVTAGALAMNVTMGGAAVSAEGLTAEAGADLTLLVTGTAASTPTLISDDNAVSTSTAHPTKIRLVNGMTGTGSTAILTDDYNTIGDGALYGAASSYAMVDASAALARLEASYGSTVLCLSTDVTLSTNSVYTVFLLGDLPTATGTCTLRKDR